jgi:hypothetical protein
VLKRLLNWLRGIRPDTPPEPMPGDWVKSVFKRDNGPEVNGGMFLCKNGDGTALFRCRDGQSYYDCRFSTEGSEIVPDEHLPPGYEEWLTKRREGLYKGTETISPNLRRLLVVWCSDELGNWGVALIGSLLTMQYMGRGRARAVGALVKRNPEFFAVSPMRERFFITDTAQQVGEAVLNNPSRFGLVIDDQSEFFVHREWR